MNQMVAGIIAILMSTFLTTGVYAMERMVDRRSCVGPGEKETSLFSAARAGEVETVKSLIRNRVLVNCKSTWENSRERTALHVAAAYGHSRVVAELIGAGAEVNVQDYEGWTPLHCAAEKDHLEVVEVLLAYKSASSAVMVNTETKLRITALQLAVNRENLAIAWLLLDAGACVDLDDFPLIFLAASKGRNDVLAKLFALNVPPDFLGDLSGKTALMIAAGAGNVSCAAVLLAAGASVHIQNPFNKKTALHYAALGNHDKMADMLIKASAEINAKDDEGSTPLHVAAGSGCQAVVAVLISHNVRQYETDNEGETALHLALTNRKESSVSLLSTNFTIKNLAGDAPIHIAAKRDLLAAITLFIAQSADLNITDEDGWTALHHAAKRGFVGIARALLDAGADSTIQAKGGSASWAPKVLPISLAFKHGHVLIVKLLLNKGQPLSIEKNSQILIPLFHSAIREGEEEITLKLLQLRILINNKTSWNDVDELPEDSVMLDDIVSPNDWTALHYAVWFGRRQILAQLLLRADVNSRNADGYTPLHFAIIRGHFESASLLVNAKAHMNGEGKEEKVLSLLLKLNVDRMRHCPYHRNCLKMLKLFLDHGAKLGSLQELQLLPVSASHSVLATIVRLQMLGKKVFGK